MTEENCKKLISLTFEGLLISSKSTLHKTSMSKLWNTGVKTETNVKRVVKIQQSAPFAPGGRPDSLIFDTIYESEEIEDISADLCPSLIAVLENPRDKDCQLRINVYYSSSITSTTAPLIMASASFSFRDFLRSKKATHRIIMGSEHCRPAPVALVRLLDKLPDTLSTASIASRAEAKDWNPLEQSYVFKREDEGEAPCYCEELTAESRLSFQMPLLFMKNFASILSETIVVWTKRAHLERLRAGNFYCREEAYTNGWYEVSIAVVGCRITATQVEVKDSASVFNDMLDGWAATATGTGTATSGGQGTGVEEEREREREREVLRPSSYVNVSLEDKDRVFRTPVGRTNTEYNTLEPCYGSNKHAHIVKAKNRNTTEYRINPSVVGDCVRLASLETDVDFETSPDGEFEVVSTSTTTSERSGSVVSVDSNSPRGSRRVPPVIPGPASPQNTAFQVYVPFLKGTEVSFEVECEDVGTGRGSVMGVCTFSLEDVTPRAHTSLETPDLHQLFSQPPVEVALHIVNKEPSYRWRVQAATLSVSVSVNQHSAGQPQSESGSSSSSSVSAPPLSPFLPHCKPTDFVNNSMLSSTRNHLLQPDEQSDSFVHRSNSNISSNSSNSNGKGNMQEEPPEPCRRPSRRISLLVPQNTEYTSDGDSDDEEDEGWDIDVLTTPTPSSSPDKPLAGAGAGVSSAPENRNRNRLLSTDSTSAFPIVNMRHEDTSQLMTDCYEFMWHLGYKGTDPLVLTQAQRQAQGLTKTQIEKETELETETDKDTETETETDSPGVEKKECTLHDRLDIPYSQEFLWDYVSKLQNMFSHMLMLISACEEEVSDGCSFRPSRLKKEIEFQPLPINFHYQVMTVQACSNADHVKDPSPSSASAGFWANPPNKNPIIVWDSVTCGSFSAHGCSHKKGGLRKLLSEVGVDKDALALQKEAYIAKIRTRYSDSSSPRSKSLSSARPLSSSSSSFCDPDKSGGAFATNGAAADMRDALIKKTENYENSIINTMLRRMYSVSQALSVAVNSFIMKLELVIENYIHPMFLERWMNHGFLIVHECLLSMSGKERTMIEDTWLAIETLKSYQVRLLPSPQDDEYRASNKWLAQNCNSESTDRKTQSSTWWHSVCSKEGGGADVYLVGREVQVFVPRSIVEQLPPAVRTLVETEGAIFPFVPVLFSQGIDIMQTIATTWDSNDDIGDFQLHINNKGVERLNEYCERVKPCSSGGAYVSDLHSKSFNPHPLTAQLLQLVRTTDVSAKNVQMLIEVERICSMVGGCRVTFCKSGKDRTGMAITLEQSRLLGEVFGTGTTDNRIIRDANVMRIHGTRIMIAEKNIGRAIYSINRLQVKFLPLFYRPPLVVTENLIKSGDQS